MLIKLVKKSNKNHIVGKTAASGDESHGAIRPFIDKITLLLHLSDYEEADEIHKSIWVQLAEKPLFQSAGSKAAKGYKRSCFLALETTHHRVLFQYDWDGPPGQAVATKLRLEFNPRKLGPLALSELAAILESMLPNGWGDVVHHARITRIDVAADLPNVRMDDLHLIPKKGASEMQWWRDGKLQTFRHGKPNGNQTIVYSVKQKRLAKGQPHSGLSVVRIERRLRSPAVGTIAKLGALENPFAGIAIVSLIPNPPPNQTGSNAANQWSMFEDSVKLRGVRAALALIPEDRRAKYRAHLKSFPKPWWKPEAIWSHWPEAYEVLVNP